MFQEFNGMQYLAIDIANALDIKSETHDKQTFDERIAWVKKNRDTLEDWTLKAGNPLIYKKAVQSFRHAEKGEAIGHLVELDATTSGTQIMSAMTGCKTGAQWTNLVDSSKRYDAYSEGFRVVKEYLAKEGIKTNEVTRKQIKQALMTGLYGSNKEPEAVFGADTVELKAFYDMLENCLEGAWELRCDLIDIWRPDLAVNEWDLPDGFHAYVPVHSKRKLSVEVDELEHRFTYSYEHYGPTEHGVSLAANVIHSIDGFMVREVSRRCNYDHETVRLTAIQLTAERRDRGLEALTDATLHTVDTSEVLSIRWLTDEDNMTSILDLDDDKLLRYELMFDKVLEYPECEVVCIHDAYKAHPNFCNALRFWYKEILAELAESDLLSQLFQQITGNSDEEYFSVDDGYDKHEMAAIIRENANYALC